MTAPIVGPSQQSAIDFVAYDRQGALPTAKYFLIATPERMYLWKQDGANSEDAGPEFTIDAAHVLQPYFDVVDRTGARERAEAQARSFVRIIVRTCRIVAGGSHRNEIVALASRGRIEVAVPAFSLAEPHFAILGKEKARARLSSDLRDHLFELCRSKSHRAIPASFENLASISYRQRAIRAGGSVRRNFGSAENGPCHCAGFGNSQVGGGVAGRIRDLRSGCDCAGVSSCTLRQSLEARGCRFFARFEEGLG